MYCNRCGNRWVLTKGTIFFGLRTPIDKVIQVLLCLSRGMGVNNICRRKNVTADSVLESITTRIIRGTKAEILTIIQKDGRSKTINTSFVESRNGKYRKNDARLNRRTMCHSKKPQYHDTQADFLTAVFNYCRQNEALKEVINSNAGLFEMKYLRKSPAMAEGLTDKILTVKELLLFRIPKNTIL